MSSQYTHRPLSQMLAVQTQIHLPGTVGRLLKQSRDLERVAPLFVEAGLVHSVDRPMPLNVRVAGIATRGTTSRTLGGFLYASAASRMDMLVEDNVLSSVGEDSCCEIDDINFENQSKRLQLIGLKQAYELAARAMEEGNNEFILMDCPLILNRSMVPPRDSEEAMGYRNAYNEAVDAIQNFWTKYKSDLFPWNPTGTFVLGIASQRFGAIVHSAQQDLRTNVGRKQVLPSEGVPQEKLEELGSSGDAIISVGERRFVNGILGSYTRTAAFRMNIHSPRMEPAEVAQMGVLGFHFRAAHATGPRLVQLIGDEPGWDRKSLDKVCAVTMALTAVGGADALPIPIQMAARELMALDNFLIMYGRGVAKEIKSRDIENVWFSDLDEEI